MKDIRICFVGDSFVNGTGDPEKLGWSGRLSAGSQSSEREITYYNLGIRRETSGDIALRWEAECQARLPNISDNFIVFSFGVNDTVIENGKTRLSQIESIENIQNILRRASEKYEVIMVGPPPIDDKEQNVRIRALDGEYAEICRRLRVPYISIFGRLENDATWKHEVSSNDGAHPRAKGYAILAEYIKEHKVWWFKK